MGPSRLIDVFANSPADGCTEIQELGQPYRLVGDERRLNQATKRSRLVDVAGVSVPYIALSYQWGSKPYLDHVTRKSSLHARFANLVEGELPETFRDAIEATRRLGIRYLWIDAICIVQDLREDWLAESAKMGSIFANALLTLIAAMGRSSDKGLFNYASTFGGAFSGGRLKLRTSSADHTVRNTLYLVRWLKTNWGSRSHTFRRPLLSRAWCLQEDLLSARKLCFANDQLYWQCDHVAISEDGLTSLTSRSDFEFQHEVYSVGGSQIPLNPSHVWYWDMIGRDYCRRHATQKTDKLIAIAGLARHVATVIKSRYLAGHWEESILQSLLWEPVEDQGRLRKTYRAPSWSWASRNFISWEFDWSQHTPDCQYLDATIKLSSDDPYGAVSFASLKLRSKLLDLDASWKEVQGGNPVFSASCQNVRGTAFVDTASELSNTAISVIPICRCRLDVNSRASLSLLVTKTATLDHYRRVGVRKVIVCDDERDRIWFDSAANLTRWTEEVVPLTPTREITLI